MNRGIEYLILTLIVSTVAYFTTGKLIMTVASSMRESAQMISHVTR